MERANEPQVAGARVPDERDSCPWLPNVTSDSG
jgi:hypothetical protein